jgi:hypothetical protein
MQTTREGRDSMPRKRLNVAILRWQCAAALRENIASTFARRLCSCVDALLLARTEAAVPRATTAAHSEAKAASATTQAFSREHTRGVVRDVETASHHKVSKFLCLGAARLARKLALIRRLRHLGVQDHRSALRLHANRPRARARGGTGRTALRTGSPPPSSSSPPPPSPSLDGSDGPDATWAHGDAIRNARGAANGQDRGLAPRSRTTLAPGRQPLR